MAADGKDPLDDVLGPKIEAGMQSSADPLDDILGPRQPKKPEVGFAKGMWNSALSGLTFGFDDEIAAQVQTGGGLWGDTAKERERMRADKAAFSESHPVWSAVGEIAGAVPTMLVPGVGISGQAVRTGRAAQTLRAMTAEGARAGAKYGAIAGVGNADPRSGAGILESAVDRTFGAGKGAIEGALIGAGVGAAARGASLVTNNAPGIRNAWGILGGGQDGIDAARRTAIGDVRREAIRDGVDFEDVARGFVPTYRNGAGSLDLPARERLIDLHLSGSSADDIAQTLSRETGRSVTPGMVRTLTQRFDTEIAPAYQGSNVLEVLRTPRNADDVVVRPNLTDLAQQAATTEGQGRAALMQSIRTRQAGMADEVEEVIGRTFGERPGQTFDDVQRAFKDGTRTEAGQRYGALYGNNQPVVDIADRGLARIVDDPVFQRAVEFAERDARVRGEAFDITQGLTPRAVDMIQRQLRKASESLSDTSAAGLARSIREQFLNVAERAMPDFWGTRGWYRTRMAAEEALDYGRALGPKSKHSGSEQFQFLRDWQDRVGQAQTAVQRAERRIQRLQRANAPQALIDDATIRLQRAQERLGGTREVVDNFRLGFGQGLRDFLDRGRNADQFLNAAETRAFRDRAQQIMTAGRATPAERREAQRAIDAMMTSIQRLQRQKDTANHLYGGSATAPRLAKQRSMDALTDLVSSLVTLRPLAAVEAGGRLVSSELRQRRADRINELFSATELRDVYDVVRRLRDAQRHAQVPLAPTPVPATGIARIDDRVQTVLGGEIRGNDAVKGFAAPFAASYESD